MASKGKNDGCEILKLAISTKKVIRSKTM